MGIGVISVERMVEGIGRLMASSTLEKRATNETIAGCQAFRRWYSEWTRPLPIDPVMLLLSYEFYQSALAEEASSIEAIPDPELQRLRSGVHNAVAALQDMVGGTGAQNADAIGLMARGFAEQMGRRIDR